MEYQQYLIEISRKNIPESDYGLPKKKKFPMPDEKHVKLAIRFFNYVDEEDEKELAKNINRKIKEYDMKDINVGDKNRFKKYYKEPVNEAMKVLEDYPDQCPFCKSDRITIKLSGETIAVCEECEKEIGIVPTSEINENYMETPAEYPIGYIFKETFTDLMSLEEKMKRKR